jgi:diacylglycerol kinase family enzyme
MNWFGIVNPAAGRKGSPYAEVVAVAEELGLDSTFRESDSSDHVDSLVSDAIDAGFTQFVSVGGDGTAHLVLNAIMGRNTGERFTLAIVSCGSGSDFTITFGHGRGIREGLIRVARPDIDLYGVDVGLARGEFGERYFLNALTVGVTAASVAQADAFPRWIGTARYTAAFWVALWRFSNADVAVKVDRHTFDGSAITVVVANGQFFGGGLNIAPRTVLADGQMDVQVFRGPRRQAFSVMPRVMRGTHLTHRGVQRFSGSQIHVAVPPVWPIEADGEILGSGSVDVEVLSDAIDFVI